MPGIIRANGIISAGGASARKPTATPPCSAEVHRNQTTEKLVQRAFTCLEKLYLTVSDRLMRRRVARCGRENNTRDDTWYLGDLVPLGTNNKI